MLITTEGGRVKWPVGDQLGTPRMVVDQSGDLAGTNQVIRHDYLPFGEEIGAGVGIRTTSNGYVGDGIRQRFTGKDRDWETGLDYFEARYYASKQGRFTSPDEFTGGPDELFDFADVASENPTLYGDIAEPQSLNKYQYCYNNPLSFVDLDGHKGWREWVKTGLEVASYIPGPIGAGASLVQAGIAVVQGDYKGAALAAMGAIPGGKMIAKVGAAVTTVAVAAVVIRKVAKSENVANAGNTVYRALRKGEDASKGLTARSPGSGNSPLSHVAGKEKSQWISTTKNLEIAEKKYGKDADVVAIDLSKVNTQVVDLSGGIPGGGRFSNYAKKDQEVLIKDRVPPEAIRVVKKRKPVASGDQATL